MASKVKYVALHARGAKSRKTKGGSGWIWLVILFALAGTGYYLWTQKRDFVEREWAQLKSLWRPTTPQVQTNSPPSIARKSTSIPDLGAPPSNSPKTNPPAASTKQNLNAQTIFEAQLALDRIGISCGCIDGVNGAQTRSALRAFQKMERLPETGDFDSATRARLSLAEPIYVQYLISSDDLTRLVSIPDTWLGKSELERLDYESVPEMLAEKGHTSIYFTKLLNPAVNWTNISPGILVKIPEAERRVPRSKAAFVRIQLSAKILEAFDAQTNLLAHFPCSIAQKVEKRPVGALVVTKLAPNPNYVFDPDNFPESAEGREIGRKLVIPPGPNNPVGTAWIGLSKPGYGIHGTPKPEQVGRTESHGCFRLANWNAEYLLQLVWVGMPVLVETD